MDANPEHPPMPDSETLELLGEFLSESNEQLGRAEEILVVAAREGASPDQVNELFRGFHTIKGVSSFLGVEPITRLAHATESLLNRVRASELRLEAECLDAVFDASALMRELLDGLRARMEGGAAPPTPDRLDVLVSHLLSSDFTRHATLVFPVTPSLLELGSKPAPPGVSLAPPGSLAPQPEGAASQAPGAVKLKETLKVDVERVDSIVEMIGELIIVESQVSHAPEIISAASPRLRATLAQLSKLSRGLQDLSMRMRMVPLRGTFQRVSRMVRELAKQTGKRVEVQVRGDATEMDRSMVEQIGDPLVHMVRNAVDHGVESPEERQRTDKPPVGTLSVAAYHEGGRVIIEIADDGRGLRRDLILRKAIEKGVVHGTGESLSDAEVHALIFAPGFSTAAQVTEISGRGVGMDVVKRNVEALRGTVQVTSTPGHGTRFRLMLPLTLAVIDGMLVRCGAETYIVPSLAVTEALRPRRDAYFTRGGEAEFLLVRGDLIPMVRLAELFEVRGARLEPWEAREGEHHHPRSAVAELRHRAEVRARVALRLGHEGHDGLVLRVVERAQALGEDPVTLGAVAARQRRHELAVHGGEELAGGAPHAGERPGAQPGMGAPARERLLELALQPGDRPQVRAAVLPLGAQREGRLGEALDDVQRRREAVGDQVLVVRHRAQRLPLGAKGVDGALRDPSGDAEAEEDQKSQKTEALPDRHVAISLIWWSTGRERAWRSCA
jgi:two-component system chemotaxis sensor kinase CheA